MDPASTTFKLTAVVGLVVVHAFFIAAEFSLAAVRRARLEARVRAGDARARHVMHALDRPAEVIAAVQLGAALAMIGTGLVAEDLIRGFVGSRLGGVVATQAAVLPVAGGALAGQLLSILLTLGLLVYLHLVLGSQVPKLVSIQRAEAVALRTVPAIRLFGLAVRPFLRLSAVTADGVLRLIGLQGADRHGLAYAPGELSLLVRHTHREGTVASDEQDMINGVLAFRERVAREVMTPRCDIAAVPVDADRDEVIRIAAAEGFSRLPVYEGSLDRVIGLLRVKDLLIGAGAGPGPLDLRAVLREPHFVPGGKRIDALLREMRERNTRMTIVLDEFGGTAGLVTLEDLLEEIVGELHEEDERPEPGVVLLTGGEALLEGGVHIGEVNERFGLMLPEHEYDTIGGFIFGALGRMALPGDRLPVGGSAELRVEATEDRRITRVRLLRLSGSAAQPEAVR
jgi:putative hemolysin